MGDPNAFDVVVVGAGVGGLITACQLAQVGKHVLLVENLSFLGGRFSGFQVNGVEIPSGAFHTIPHGNKGPFSQALRRSGVILDIPDAKVFASFHINGKHFIARNPVEVLKLFQSTREQISVLRGMLQTWGNKDYAGSFGDWLAHIGMSDTVQLVYDRFCQFALSTTVFDVPYVEGRKVIEMIFKYGLPGVPRGGARIVTRQLGLAAKQAGVVIRKNTQAINFLLDENRICGVTLFERRSKKTYKVVAPLVISNMGPDNTIEMCQKSGLSIVNNDQTWPKPPPSATGFKLQVLSPKSLIDHDSIMFCLDTQRVAGILQASNVDPNLAPPGKHLLISHQATDQGSDWQEERALAIKDWQLLFGADFDDCEILGSSNFPERFPVNWALQGYDIREQFFADQGLWMVGDGFKVEGLMMVEGVGANAESVVGQILGIEGTLPWEVSQFAVWLQTIQKWVRKLW